jgi:hypothetical protein
MQRKLNLYVQYCSIVLFKKSTINIGISLYNKAQDQVKLREHFNSFKKSLKSFLLKHSFPSVDEFILFCTVFYFLFLLMYIVCGMSTVVVKHYTCSIVDLYMTCILTFS